MKRQTSESPKTLQGQYAGFISRLLAYFIDLLVVIVIIALVGITVDLFLRFFHLDDIIDTLRAGDNLLGNVLRFLAFAGSIAFISFSYFVLSWTLTAGQSIGKLLIGVRIVPLDGSRISLWRAIVRYLAFLLSAFVFFIGLLWVLVSNSRQGWHDKIANTCVIYDWPARENDGVIGSWHYRREVLRQSFRRPRGNDATNDATGNERELAAQSEEIETA
jgi:uncharacterized RDD family membrane protein YckC